MSTSELSSSRASKTMAHSGQSSHSDDSDSSRPNTRQDSWEVVEGLRGALGNAPVPEVHEGFLLKKRKWPMKGWHKRYFLLDKGILKYAKTGADLQRGKYRGCIDVGLSVMSIKKKSMCIDLDTEDSIYHLKVKSRELFEDWVSKLRHHRVYRQNEIAMDPSERHLQCDPGGNMRNAILTKQASLHAVSGLLQSTDGLDQCSQDLDDCEAFLLELNLLLKNMEVLQHAYSAPAINMLTGDGSKKEKRPRKWRSKTSNRDSNASLQVPSPTRLHVSNPNLSASDPSYTDTFVQTPDSPTNAARLQEDFCRLASTIHSTLSTALRTLRSEKHQIKMVLEQPGTEDALTGMSSPLRLQRSNESRGSLSDSLSEFYDAREYLLSSSSTDNEVSDDDNDSFLSDASDSVSVDFYNSEIGSEKEDSASSLLVARRSRLPCPSSDSSVSLWNILRNNIGKDLSKVSMPVHLNEPLNTLQRLCEETEYSPLLDTAAHTSDPHLRMVYVAVFAVSAYASTFHRAGWKPFNPVLGETYECDRPDRGFRFIAEQVSHHPPVSACHCESKNFILWQDVRWKNKFWGKSMEIVPMGTTHVVLPGVGDHYEWNKVTSCIHNILSGQRWIEHYGEMSIKNTVSSSNSSSNCKVTFVKGRAGTSNLNDVEGIVTDSDGHIVHTFFGKWNEAVYLGDPPSATCIWRANVMPEDFERFYGLTQFAIELNELDEKDRPLLPPTDTRFRPDQRLLEEGDVSGAEEQKERVEGLQRERRRILQENNMSHQPRFFKRSDDDAWVTNGTYWDLRREPGFKQMDFPLLW